MKKFILTLLVLGFLAFAAAIAAIPVFAKVWGPDLITEAAPPTGLPLGERDFPIPERSIVAVKLELPVAALSEIANQNTPRELTGSERKSIHEKVKDAVINWRMWPGQLSLTSRDNKLVFDLPIHGDAHGTGKVGLLKLPGKGSAKMNGTITGAFSPEITPDWNVIVPDLRPEVKIHHAEITLGKMGTRDGRAEIESALKPKIEAETAKIAPNLTEALNLKPGVQKLWNLAHVTREVSADPLSWVVFDPGLVQMSRIDYSSPEFLSITVGMVAQSFIANTQPHSREPEEVPRLTIVDDHLQTDIRIPLIVNYSVLNHSLKDRTFAVPMKFGAPLFVSEPKITPGTNGYVNVSVKATVQPTKFSKPVSCRLRLHGKPLVDCRSQMLGFSDVSVKFETKEVLTGTTAWLMEDILVKSLEKEMRIDLKEHLPAVEEEIHKVITSAPVPENITLHFERPRVALLGAYTVERNGWNEEASPGIVFVMGAKGKIDVRLNTL